MRTEAYATVAEVVEAELMTSARSIRGMLHDEDAVMSWADILGQAARKPGPEGTLWITAERIDDDD